MSDKKAVLTRSWLFTPATRPERFGTGIKKGADVSIIDLEDSVSPAEKDASRTNTMTFLATDSQYRAFRALRINDIATHYGIRDITALLNSKTELAFIVLPKTESPAHLRILDRLLSEAGAGARLVALIESVEGLKNVDAIACSTPRLAGLMFGAADMASDLGCDAAWQPLLCARSRMVSACVSAGITAIDTPFFDIHNEAGLSDEVHQAKSLGFTAKAAIHPAQVSTINRILPRRVPKLRMREPCWQKMPEGWASLAEK